MGSDAITQIRCLQEVNNVINALGGGGYFGVMVSAIGYHKPSRNIKQKHASTKQHVDCSL